VVREEYHYEERYESHEKVTKVETIEEGGEVYSPEGAETQASP